jgi:hypothetical protein
LLREPSREGEREFTTVQYARKPKGDVGYGIDVKTRFDVLFPNSPFDL